METRICGSGVGVAEGGDESRSIDVVMEYAKAVADDILIRSSVGMRDPEAAPLAFAQAPPSTPAPPVTWSSLSGRFQIDTGYFGLTADTLVRYKGPQGASGEVSLEDDLGLNDHVDTYWLDATWRVGRRDMLKLGFTRFNRERAGCTLQPVQL